MSVCVADRGSRERKKMKRVETLGSLKECEMMREGEVKGVEAK